MLINLSYATASHASGITRVFERSRMPLRKLFAVKNKSQMQKMLKEIQAQTGLTSVSENNIGIKSGGRKIDFYFEDTGIYRITEQNLEDEAEIRDVLVSYQTVKEAHGIEKKPELIEKFINEVCDIFDFPLVQLMKIFINEKFTNFMENFSETAKLSSQNIEIVNEIKTLFNKINEEISSLETDKSKASAKRGFSQLKKGVSGSKQIEFAGIGENGEDYFINILKDRKLVDNVVIKVNGKNFTVMPDGSVYKTKYSGQKRNPAGPVPYSQKELDNSEISRHLITLRDFLRKYYEHLITKVNEREEYKFSHTTGIAGSLSSECRSLVSEIEELYKKIKKNLQSKAKTPEKAQRARKNLQIQTTLGSPAMIFKNFGQRCEDIQLSFHSLRGVPSLKLLVLGFNNKVKKTFYVQGEKLVKFSAENLIDNPRADLMTNYYSREEIEASSLLEYLRLLHARLLNIDERMSKDNLWYK